MRTLLLILSFTIMCSTASAQDTTAHEKKGIISTIREKLKAPAKKISQRNVPAHNVTADTLNLSFADTLQLRHKLDSLSSLPARVYSNGEEKKESLQQKVNSPLEKIDSEISSAEDAVNQKLGQVNAGVNEKTGALESKLHQGFDTATDGEVRAPDDLDIQKATLKLTESPENMAGMELPDTDLQQPAIDLPSTEELDKLSVDKLKEKASIDLPGADKISDVKGEFNKVDSKLADAEKYELELREIKEGDFRSTETLSKEAEQKVAGMDQVKGVTGELQKVSQQQAQYEAMIQKYRDKKLVQQEVMRKAQNVANEMLNKFSPAVKEVEMQIAKARKLNPSAKGLNDITKRSNPMKHRPFYERLVPGITLQAYKTDVFQIDWGAQLGFKLSGRLMLGAGGVYRLGISEKYPDWIKGQDVYGYRGFACFNVLKGIYAHGEFESLHIPASIHPFSKAEISRHNAYNGNFGLGKRYDISKKIRGSVLVLYRAEIDGYMPSVSKVNLRVGFDYNTKKQKKIKF